MLYDSSTSNTHIDLIKQYNIFLVSIVPFAAPQNRILVRFFVSQMSPYESQGKNIQTFIPTFRAYCVVCEIIG